MNSKIEAFIVYLEGRLEDPDFWQAVATMLTALGGHYVLALTPTETIEVAGTVFATLHGVLPNVFPAPPKVTNDTTKTN